jgi:AraC-like DNA-binding protein
MTKLEAVPPISQYAERAPTADRASTAHLACVWTGTVGADGGYTDRILPDACIDVIWTGTDLFVAGPDTGPVVNARAPGSFFVGVRFSPGHGPAFLGAPAAAILDQRVDLADLWDEAGVARLRDDLAAQPSLAAAGRALERHIGTRAPADDPLRAAHVTHLAADHDVADVADALGLTERTLHRHCTHDFGYGAKTLHRVLRFRRFLARAEAGTETLARVAAECGYADQAHLTRDCRRLSGLAPAALLASRGVRSVQDDR